MNTNIRDIREYKYVYCMIDRTHFASVEIYADFYYCVRRIFIYADEGQIMIVITVNRVHSKNIGIYRIPFADDVQPRFWSILIELGTLGHTILLYPLLHKNTHTYIDSRRIAVSGSLAIIRLSWCYVGVFRELPIISASSFAGYDQSELIEEAKLTICFLVLGNVHSCDYLECQFLHFCPESRSQMIRPASHQD